MARLHRVLATLALLVAATALCAAPALARKRDHDKLPDRWERKFHLSTKKNDANRDRDRDGLSNFREYRVAHEPAQEGHGPRRPQGRRRAPLRLQAARPGLRQRRHQGRQGERGQDHRAHRLVDHDPARRGRQAERRPRGRLLGRRRRRSDAGDDPATIRGRPGRRPRDRRRVDDAADDDPTAGRPRRPPHDPLGDDPADDDSSDDGLRHAVRRRSSPAARRATRAR